MAVLLKQPILDEIKRRRFGGHTPRVAGARHLARIDVPTPVIMLLARWASSVVLRYIADAPLTALTKLYKQRLASSQSASTTVGIGLSDKELSIAVSKHMAKPLSQLQYVTDVIAQLKVDIDQIAISNDSLAATLKQFNVDLNLLNSKVAPSYVLNTKEGKLHRAAAMNLELPDSWSTARSWKFGRKPGAFRLLPAAPDALAGHSTCFRCFGL